MTDFTLLLAALDPTKLKPRQFGRSTVVVRDSDTSLWTETPAERQQRLADEVSGRKRRAANAEPVEDGDEDKKRRRRDAEIRKGVEEHTVSHSPVCLLHTQTLTCHANSATRADLPWSTHTWKARTRRKGTRTSLHLPSGIIHGTCPSEDVLWMTNNGKICCKMPRALEIALEQGKVVAFCNMVSLLHSEHVSCDLSFRFQICPRP